MCDLTKIKGLRNDIKFDNLVEQKEKFILSKQEDYSFTPLVLIRARRIKTMVGELALDEYILELIDNFKIKTYNVILDILLTQINERFNENLTPLYKDIPHFQRKRLKEVEKLSSSSPLDTFNEFESIYSKFVSADALKKEFVQFCNAYFSYENIVQLPQKLHEEDVYIVILILKNNH